MPFISCSPFTRATACAEGVLFLSELDKFSFIVIHMALSKQALATPGPTKRCAEMYKRAISVNLLVGGKSQILPNSWG